MHLIVDNIYTKATELTEKEQDFLETHLVVSVPNHEFMPSFKSKNWDGKKRFFSVVYKQFLTGFLPFLLREAVHDKIHITVTDIRRIFPLRDPSTLHDQYPKLRDYQVQALQDVFNSYLRFENKVIPWTRGLLKLPTGSGKTFVTACMVDFIQKKTLYIVDRRNLAHQVMREFQAVTKKRVGILGDGQDDRADITIAMIQTLKQRYRLPEFVQFLKSIDLLVIDECHKLSKGMYHNVAMKCPAPIRLGLSGTPLSRTNLGDLYLIADTGELLTESHRQDLEEAGYLAKPKVYMFPVIRPNGLSLRYQQAYDDLIVNGEERNSLIVQAVQKLIRKGCTILILVAAISHGNLLRKLLKDAKIKSVFVAGSSNSEIRAKALGAVGSEYPVLIASKIFDEGMDAGHLNALIMAGGGAANAKTIQRVGRVARPKPGENVCYVVDFVDKNNAYLLRHSSARVATYEAEGFSVHYPKQM